jgi:regulator of protease activity HflC (stomatin/prohibitin superfamily)
VLTEIAAWFVLIIGLFFGAMILFGLFYTVKEWEQTAIMRFGKIIKVTGSGLHTKAPLLDSRITVDQRTQTVDLRRQSAITKDNISVAIDAVVFMKVEEPKKLILQIGPRQYKEAVAKYAQSSIRDIVGKYTLDALLENREEIASKLKIKVDSLTNKWGIDVTNAEIQDINLPADMQRAFAVQAEAERESRAIQIKAKAELQASDLLRRAAETLDKSPNSIQLRMLETLTDVSKDQSNTIIFALPTETLLNSGVGGLAAMASINSSSARERMEKK